MSDHKYTEQDYRALIHLGAELAAAGALAPIIGLRITEAVPARREPEIEEAARASVRRILTEAADLLGDDPEHADTASAWRAAAFRAYPARTAGDPVTTEPTTEQTPEGNR